MDKETGAIEKFEGNPVHPGSRGRTCAKGPATINQVRDPERILTPLKRVGPRGAGRWKKVSWKSALNDIGRRVRRALDDGRHDEIMYHVGRPGEDHFAMRVLQAWGVDGHNSHTNVCSASARTGYQFWMGADRPSPDYSRTKFMLLLSAHLETGHYFNPHAQRILAAKESGARLAVIDTRLSNTASHADLWVSPWPGTEAALLLAVAHELLRTGRYDADFVRRWTNWEHYLQEHDADGPGTFERFIELLVELYDSYTPEYVAYECKVPVETVQELADEIAAAGSCFSSHLWRNAASGNLGGWQIARALVFLHVLSGSLGTPGGVNPNSWDKFVPKPSETPPPGEHWNERIWPREYPLAHYEMSFLLPHLLRRQEQRVEVYFSRVYNPVWTNPDGCSWIEMFEDEERIGCHVALTPIWSETAQWADYVLPMGLAPERHDVMSQETHAGTWIGFRQPVVREFLRGSGKDVASTRDANPGEVWEEAEFWVALTWRIDPNGKRGLRKYFESKERPGQPISMDEYWADVFTHVPGLAEAAAAAGLEPLAYMRRYGAFEVPYAGQQRYERAVEEGADGVQVEGRRLAGFKTPSGRLEFFSPTLSEWGFEDQAVPGYVRSQVHWSQLDLVAGDRVLLPTFRLPTLIHTRSGNAKWLVEIAHTNPLWVHPEDAELLELTDGGLAKVHTRIGWFVLRAWVTEGIHPGVVACSHHTGRWRLHREVGGERQATALVDVERTGETVRIRQKRRRSAQFKSSQDRDTQRTWWKEVGVQPEPVLPGAAGPGQRHALLASEGARGGGRARRPLRRPLRRPEAFACGLRGVARRGPTGAGARRPAPAGVVESAPASRRSGFPLPGVAVGSKSQTWLRKALLAIGVFAVSFASAEVGWRLYLRATEGPYDAQRVRERLGGAGERAASNLPVPGAAGGEDADRWQTGLHPFIAFDVRHALTQVREDELYFRSPAADAGFEILVLGGSVAASFSHQGGPVLARQLRRAPALAGRDVRVLAYGRAAHKEPQQVNTLVYLLGLGFRPDLVLNLDGFNEVAQSNVNAERDTNPAYPSIAQWSPFVGGVGSPADVDRLLDARSAQNAVRVLARRWVDSPLLASALVGSLATARLERAQRRMVATQERYVQQREPSLFLRGPEFDREPEAVIERGVELWVEGSRSLQALCASRGMLYLHALQPTLHDGVKTPTDLELETGSASKAWLEAVEHGYPKLRTAGADLSAQGIEFVDLTGVFADEAQTIYVDACHVNARGNELMALRLARAVRRRFGARIGGSAPR